jgi:hypothetical protein
LGFWLCADCGRGGDRSCRGIAAVEVIAAVEGSRRSKER